MALPENPQQQLAWEARHRPRAAIAAGAAGLLILAGQIFRGAAFRDAPRANFLEALQRAQQPGPIGTQPSVQTGAAQYLSDHAASWILPAIAEGLGYIALAYTLTFLAAATRARREQFPRLATYLPAIGAVLTAMVTVVGALGRMADINGFLDGPRTVDAAKDIGFGPVSLVAQIAFLPASLALAAAYVLVSLNAMRAGLLTRFMGVLGVIAGGLVVIQLGPFPVVQTVWLVGLAILLTGRRPGGDPPAWRTGREEPWPSQQEVAEARRRRAEERAPEEPVAVAAGGPSRSSSRRKRKRRR